MNPQQSLLTVKVDGSLNNVVTHDVSVGKILGDNGGLAVSLFDIMESRQLTFGLSSWEIPVPVTPAPIGVEPVAPEGKTEALGSASEDEVTSRWAPSSYTISICMTPNSTKLTVPPFNILFLSVTFHPTTTTHDTGVNELYSQ